MRNGTGRTGKNMSHHQENRGGAVGSLKVSIAALAACVAAVLSLAGTASAHQLYQYEFEKSITGADTTQGAFTSGIRGIALNQAGHRIYVLDRHPAPCCSGEPTWISQLNLNGEAVPFSG